MSIANENNRPLSFINLGNVAADGDHLVLYAHKDLLIQGASVVFHAALAASNTNHVALKLVKRAAPVGDADGVETDVGAAVTTRATAFYKGSTLALTVAKDYLLKKGESLVLNADTTGAGAINPLCVALDIQIRGS